MIRAARQDESSQVRGPGAVLAGAEGGGEGRGTITRAIDDDPDTQVKEKAVFALSQLPRDQGVPLLIDVARNNRNREVRKKAMFWLGQSNDERALAFIEDVLTKHRSARATLTYHVEAQRSQRARGLEDGFVPFSCVL